MLRFLRIITVILIAGGSLGAQDVHFTQFDLLPVQFNAAQTGAFEGSYRLALLYRGQWFGGVKNGYQTPAISVDAPFNGFRKNDWIGIGLNLYQDKAGAASLTNLMAGLSAAYHFSLDRKRSQVLSFGAQAAYMSRKVDKNALLFGDAIQLGTPASADLGVIANDKNYVDFNIGADYRAQIDKYNTFSIGGAMEHFLTPAYNLQTQSISKLPSRFTALAQWKSDISKYWTFSPSAIFRTASGSTETMVQGIAGFKLDKEKTIRAGLGYRVGDAAQIIGGLDIGDFRASAAYDLTLTDLKKVGNIHDGFEIGVSYIGKIFSLPNPPPVILCPRF